jgi:hypothetical protein
MSDAIFLFDLTFGQVLYIAFLCGLLHLLGIQGF